MSGRPSQALRALNTDRLPRAIVSFMDRPLSSDLVSGTTEQRQIRVVLKAIETDPHLLQRTFYQALGVADSAVFQCMEFVYLADGWTNDGDVDVCFLAKHVVAVAISRLGDHKIDDRWSSRMPAELVTIPPFQIPRTTRQRQSSEPCPDRPGAEFRIRKTQPPLKTSYVLLKPLFSS